MAILRLTDGTIYHDRTDIDRELAPLNIQLQKWPIGDDPQLIRILDQPQLIADNQDPVLQNIVFSHLDHYFEQLKPNGYQYRDIIAIHPALAGLDEMLAKFDRSHTHTDDEVRYIVAGEGIFGFVRPDKSQIELTVQATEQINIPAGTEHWFYLTPDRRFVALRYFINTNGWDPEYLDTPILFREFLAT
jgi:1,2-dihydroxy-3-keto-5-methylthiopentene dioxygenase